MEGLKIEKTKVCHFIPKIFSPRNTKREIDMDNTFVFFATKVHIF
jgi:hypothetical protein